MSLKPTTILTGFLGSGKTTYLNFLLERKPDTRYAIIENEYGEQSIDSELILRAEDDIVELNNGCLCCTLNDNLYDILNTLFERREEYDEVIIEATGVADPRGLAEPFIVHPAIKKQFPLTRIICLIDAELVEDQIKETEEAIHQITFSDVLLISKSDLVSKEHLTALEKRLRSLNPLATIAIGNKDSFPLFKNEGRNAEFDDKLLHEHHDHHHSHDHHHEGHHHHDDHHDHHAGHDHDHPSTSEKMEHFPVHKPHGHHHHDHTDDVVSHTVVFDQPFSHHTLHHRLTVYLMFQAKGLYRMKGLLWFKEANKQYLLQSVGKRLVIDEKRTWEENEEQQSKIVFIGKNIQKEPLEKMLGQCLA